MTGKGFDSRGTSFSDSNTDIKTGRPVKESLRSLDTDGKVSKAIGDIQPRSARPLVVSTGRKSGSNDAGSGIDSPLTEVSAIEVTERVTDITGAFSIDINYPKEVLMKDDSDREVNFIYTLSEDE